MKTAYIVRAYRTAVGKAPRGLFRFKRPDELAAETVAYLMNSIPELDKKRIDDVIVGNAMPEACWNHRFRSCIGQGEFKAIWPSPNVCLELILCCLGT